MTIANEGFSTYEPQEPNKPLEPIERHDLSAANNIDYEPETALEEELKSEEGEVLESEIDEGFSVDESEFFHIVSEGSVEIRNAVNQEEEKEEEETKNFKKSFKTTHKTYRKAIPNLLFISKILGAYDNKEWLEQENPTKTLHIVITTHLEQKVSDSVMRTSHKLQEIFALQKNKLRMFANLSLRDTQMVWEQFLEKSITTNSQIDLKKKSKGSRVKKRNIILLTIQNDKDELYERSMWIYQFRHINDELITLNPILDIQLFPGNYHRKWSVLVKKTD